MKMSVECDSPQKYFDKYYLLEDLFENFQAYFNILP